MKGPEEEDPEQGEDVGEEEIGESDVSSEEEKDNFTQLKDLETSNETHNEELLNRFQSDNDNKEKDRPSVGDDKLHEGLTNKNEEDLSENEDKLEDLSAMNRDYKPFRNEESMGHVNEHLMTRQRSSDSMCSTASTVMDRDIVRQKIKRQMKSEKQRQQARRIRKSGEASAVTRKKRETQSDIKQSMGAVWGL